MLLLFSIWVKHFPPPPPTKKRPTLFASTVNNIVTSCMTRIYRCVFGKGDVHSIPGMDERMSEICSWRPPNPMTQTLFEQTNSWVLSSSHQRRRKATFSCYSKEKKLPSTNSRTQRNNTSKAKKEGTMVIFYSDALVTRVWNLYRVIDRQLFLKNFNTITYKYAFQFFPLQILNKRHK